MGKEYWIGRKRAAMRMARAAATSQARLIHYELAGRYSIKAAASLPFLLPRQGPASAGERAVLHLPAPFPPRPRGKPGGPVADGR
jgi:hypothetical protein